MPVTAVIAVFALVLGLAALVLMTVTVYEQVKSLGRTVAKASERIAAASLPSGPRGSDDVFSESGRQSAGDAETKAL